MIKVVIFDCFGVLVGKGFDYTYKLAGGDPESDKTFIDEILEEANLGRISNRELTLRIADHLNISLDDWLAAASKAEAADEKLLEYIKELRRSYKTAILSNSNKEVLCSRISQSWLNEAFDEVIVSAEIGMAKPDPRIYKYVADQFNVQLNECVFVDNREKFVGSAAKLGMHAIVYENFDRLKEELTKILS